MSATTKNDVMPPAEKKARVPFASNVRPWAAYEQPPAGAIAVHTYKAYLNMVQKWVDGDLDDTLIVIGPGGIGKSEQALKMLHGLPHLYLKGQATKYGVYLQLLSHIDQPVVLDDVDTLLASKDVSGLLKMLLETRSPRSIQWSNATTLMPDSEVPASFATKSRTMILCNELNTVSKNFAAVLDRATILWFAPSPTEIHTYAKSWVKDSVVYKYVGERLHAAVAPSCRFYYHGKKWKDAGLDWKKMLEELMFPSDSKAMLIKVLEGKHTTAKERVAEWRATTGETEQSYWSTKRAVDMKEGKINKRGRLISEAMKRKHAERKAAKMVDAVEV